MRLTLPQRSTWNGFGTNGVAMMPRAIRFSPSGQIFTPLASSETYRDDQGTYSIFPLDEGICRERHAYPRRVRCLDLKHRVVSSLPVALNRNPAEADVISRNVRQGCCPRT